MLFTDILQLQAVLILMMSVGFLCKKTGMIDEKVRSGLTGLCLDVIIPCNVIKAGMSGTSPEALKSSFMLLFSGTLILLATVLANRFLYRNSPEAHRCVMQYCSVAAMSGFFGNPIAEALYGAEGILYVSLFLIPMRVAMWSVGPSYFISDRQDPWKIVKKSLTNPAMIGTLVGLLLLFTGWKLPYVLARPVELIGACNTPLIMILIGTFLADISWKKIAEKDVCRLSLVRLLLIPAFAWGLGYLLGLRGTALSVSVFMSGAPAGATAPIMAARYGGDAVFASKCIVFTTACSLVTLPLWCYVTG